jgi:ribosomal protein S18 acetylase RimI-like enzyme
MNAPSPEVYLRRLRREDISAAQRLANESFNSEATGALVHQMLTIHCDTIGQAPLNEQTGVMVATEYYALHDETTGTLIGLSGLYRTVWTDASVYSLGWFCVSPARQREGLGRLLLEATMQIAVLRGGRRMVIETSPDAEAALRLYGRLGFEECGRVPDYFGPGVPLVLLSCALEGAQFNILERISDVA